MILQARDIRKSYAQGEGTLEVLRGVSFGVARGRSLAIVGPSGGGKSTLLSILAGVERPTAGALEVDGRDAAALSEDEWTKLRGARFGIVYQQFHLLGHLTARENVELPLEIAGVADRSRAGALLGEVGLAARADHMPAQLSGGEIQRVAIARALVHAPSVILADEPSGNLDLKTADTVMDLLFDLARKHDAALVLVTHNPALARRCDETKTLENGILAS